MTRPDTLPAKGKLSSLKYLFSYLLPYRRNVIFASIALIFTSGGVLSMGYAFRYLIDEGIAKRDPYLLGNGYIILLAVVVALALATYARYLFVSWVGERVVADIRRDVFSKILSMDTVFFETTRTGDLLSRLTTDTTLLQTVVGSSVSIFLRNVLLFTGGLTMLLITSVKLSNYVLLMLPLVLIPIVVLGKRVRVLSRATQNKVADLSSTAEESISAIRTIHAMAMEDAESIRFNGLVEDTLKTALARIRMRAALTAIVICLVFGAVVTVLYVGGQDVIAGRISAGELSSFIFYAVVVAGALGAVSEVIGELQRAAGATERLMETMAMAPTILAPAEPHLFTKKPLGRLSFEHITFHYPSRPDVASLSNVSFRIEPGETVAIVGPSGASKTTIFQLLLRFYDAQFGLIRIDGHDLRTLDPKQWRSHIGMVPQDPMIFSADAWTNIRAGKPDATDDEVRAAAKTAEALDFINALPNGFDTHLGEKGVRLSGGQRQRIAIARAIIRNPSLLLLDEATSALDAENETIIQAALETIMKERTTLVIAHRLSTVINADRIMVMQNGIIQEMGTHEQLLETSALYKRLAELQFA